jgi:hypothetical protein
MKTITTLFLTLLLLNGCGPKMTKEMRESTITYQAVSRGLYLDIEIQGSKMTISRERETLGKAYILSHQDFKDVARLYHKINLDDLAYYKAPTEKRFYDGAAIANMSVNYNGEKYQSQGFDHGNPPIEIAEFVNKIVSFTEN